MPDNLPDQPHAGRGHPKIDIGELIRQRYVQGLELHEIASIHGVHKSAVQARLKWLQNILPNAQELIQFRAGEEQVLDGIKAKMVAEIVRPAKLEKLSAAQAAWIYGVMFDKHRLHTGKSTANISHQLTAIIQQAQDDD